MSAFWQNFITYISSTAVIGIAVGWVLRRLIDNFFSHKIEQYKNELSKDYAQFQITYEKLHEERAAVIKETYKKIVGAFESFKFYMSPLQRAGEPIEEEKRKEAGKAANDFINYFEQNRIFFAEDVATKIDKIKDMFWDCWMKYDLSKDMKNYDVKGSVQNWSDVWATLTDSVPVIKKEIEKEFRNIIGIK